MKEISYQDAVELMAFARTNDVQIAIRADRYSFCEIKRMTEAGAIFLVPDDPEPELKQPINWELNDKLNELVDEMLTDTPADPKSEKPKRRTVDKGKVLALHAAGWSAAKIADEMRCSTQTVYRIVSEAKEVAEEC